MIDQLIKEATLSKDRVALNAYKNLKAELQKVLTSKNAPEYSEALFSQICMKYAKKLEEAISQFLEADRGDLVLEYRSELEVVRKLLPEPVNESDIISCLISTDIIQFAREHKGHEIGVQRDENNNWIPMISKKEMGLVIKWLKAKFPTADGKMISDIVKKYTV